MATSIITKSVRAVQALKTIGEELRSIEKIQKSPGKLKDNQTWLYLSKIADEHRLTQRRAFKGEKDVENLALAYATYLTSTRRLQDLQATYHSSAEASVENAAHLVGLRTPNEVKESNSTPKNDDK